MYLRSAVLALLVHGQIAFAAPEPPKSDLPKPPAPPTRPTEPPQAPQYEGVGRIDQITRDRGGDLYRLDLIKSLPLVRLEAKSKLGRMKIYSVALVTDKSEKIQVRQFVGLTLDEAQAPLSSEMFQTSVNITGIEVLAEAMGGEAALEIKAFSTKEAPRLTLGSRIPSFSCKRNIDALLKDKLDPVQLWVKRAESSAPGSVQEKFAGNQLKEQVKDFVATMNTAGSYTSHTYLVTLMNFFADQYNAVRAGGVSEPAYKDLLMATYDVLVIAIQNELPCRRYPSDVLLGVAMDFNKKVKAMPADGRARPLFTTIMNKIRDFAPEQYRKEITAANLSFRESDNEGSKYFKMYMTAPDGDFLKDTNKNMSAYAFVMAEQALKREVKMMDIEQRFQLIVEYQGKMNSGTEIPQAVAARYLNILAEETYGFPLFFE
ncbi:beta-sandwich domain-containing protein [Bdellovibrio sp.]|uniref:beta-sandwich domain-containing protein n=1 Tax=Bdellovibrio sp. TaxID=28201 RepID=UPI0032220026